MCIVSQQHLIQGTILTLKLSKGYRAMYKVSPSEFKYLSQLGAESAELKVRVRRVQVLQIVGQSDLLRTAASRH